jgi:hypothetical protein
MDGVPKERISRRRSLRIVMRVPLLINVVDSDFEIDWEPVETIVISLHGGLIRTRQMFPVGSTLDIRMRHKDRSTRGRVVWTAESKTNGNAFEMGFEILDQPGFWEVAFPPDRWVEETQAHPLRR